MDTGNFPPSPYGTSRVLVPWGGGSTDEDPCERCDTTHRHTRLPDPRTHPVRRPLSRDPSRTVSDGWVGVESPDSLKNFHFPVVGVCGTLPGSRKSVGASDVVVLTLRLPHSLRWSPVPRDGFRGRLFAEVHGRETIF